MKRNSLVLVLLALSAPAHTGYAYANANEGSSFAKVWEVVSDQNFTPEKGKAEQEFEVYQRGEFPRYPMDWTSVFGGGSEQLKRDANRTLSKHEDYFDRLPKLLHPNGVCVSGTWEITQPSNYTGLFKTGAKALIIARISSALSGIDYDEKRGAGFAGKLFATEDANEAVETANFFSVDVLTGQKNQRFLKTAFTNEPETGFDFSVIGLGLKVASILSSADSNPGFRPLYPLSEMNIASAAAVTPHWIKIQPSRSLRGNRQSDFRSEIIQGLADNNGTLSFDVSVSETTKDRTTQSGWSTIGRITVDRAVVSYGCDRRLHFAHPRMTR